MVCKILLVGSGLTGAVTGYILRQKWQKHVYLVMWEKEKGIGGRLCTSKSPSDPDCILDLGAQYITVTQDNLTEHSEIYDTLMNKKLLEPLCSKITGLKESPFGTKNFVAPNGMTSLVEHLILGSADDIQFEHNVHSIFKQDKKWLVETKGGVKDVFDIVLLTIPVPQILQLSGSIQEIISKDNELEMNLKSVKFSSRYTLGLFFNSDYKFETEWDAKYEYDDEIFRFISFDNQKRNRSHFPTAVVFHTSIQYGETNKDRDLGYVQDELVNHVQNLFPTWPCPKHVKCLRWQYSQVMTPYKGQPQILSIEQCPLLLAGGDSFSSSHINNCISSAVLLANTAECAIKKIV